MKKNIILLTNNEMETIKGGNRFEDIKAIPAPKPPKEEKKDKPTG